MNIYRGTAVGLRALLTSTVYGGDSSDSRSGRFEHRDVWENKEDNCREDVLVSVNLIKIK